MTHYELKLKQAPSLLSQALTDTRALLATEVELAKREMTNGLKQAGVGAALYTAAGLLALTAFHAIAASAVVLLVQAGWSIVASILTVTGVLIALSVTCGLIGRSKLNADTLTPKKAVENLKTDFATVKEASNV
jgi:hypothetical protein